MVVNFKANRLAIEFGLRTYFQVYVEAFTTLSFFHHLPIMARQKVPRPSRDGSVVPWRSCVMPSLLPTPGIPFVCLVTIPNRSLTDRCASQIGSSMSHCCANCVVKL